MPEFMTASRLACFRSCPRKYWIRYVARLRQDKDGFALRAGTAFHAAMDAEARGMPYTPEMDDPYETALVAAMVAGHRARYRDDRIEVVETERPFDVMSYGMRHRGVRDRVVRMQDGRLALMEYKSTSQDFSPGAPYWARLEHDAQLSIYVAAARAEGLDVSTVIYDVTRRPAHRPKMATPPADRKYTKEGRLYANQRGEDETPEEFAGRVAQSMHDDMDHYFARREVARLEMDLALAGVEIGMVSETIDRGMFWRNPSSCDRPWPCEFVGICGMSNLSEMIPAGFRRDQDPDPELSGHATPGGEPRQRKDDDV